MPVSTKTATTGSTTPWSKSPAIGYSVWYDLADQADQNTVGHTITTVVDSADAEFFTYHMMGWAGLTGSTLQRVLPEKSGFDSRMYAVKMESVFRNPDNPATNNSEGWPNYDIQGYRVTYAIPLYAVLEDDEITYEHERFCVWRKRVTAQNEQIPGGGFLFVSGTASERTPLNQVGVKTGSRLELTCKWLDVPIFDYAKISTYCNKINSAAVTWDGTTYDAGKVLFIGADEEPRVNASGQRTRDINLTFSVITDDRTWNKFWKSGSAGLVEVSSDGTTGGTKPFTTADLNQIWTFT